MHDPPAAWGDARLEAAYASATVCRLGEKDSGLVKLGFLYIEEPSVVEENRDFSGFVFTGWRGSGPCCGIPVISEYNERPDNR